MDQLTKPSGALLFHITTNYPCYFVACLFAGCFCGRLLTFLGVRFQNECCSYNADLLRGSKN